jgi:hypothetical protein
MAPLVQLAVLQPEGLEMFHTLLLKWSYVLHVRGAPKSQESGHDEDDEDDDDDDHGW